jgi:hypothetical protein
VRTSLKLVVVIAVVAACVALLAGSAGKLSHEHRPRVSTTIPSDHTQLLKGDLELRSFSRDRQFNESFPALAGNVDRIPDSGNASERLFQISYFGRTARVPFSLYQRPPPV